MRSVAVLIVTCALLGASAAKSYEGYKVYKFVAPTHQHAYLASLDGSPDFDFWSRINKVGNPVSVMVAPKRQAEFEKYLKSNGIEYNIDVEDVESTIQEERKYHFRMAALNSGRITFEQYIRHSEINSYLASLAESYSDVVTLESIGQSYEGRDMPLIRISTGSSSSKPVVFIDGGIHAREWISPATALYIINQLVENSANRYLIENVDWIVLPVLNPDGYEYTWTNERLWRKTRSPGRDCNGVDGNRNFDFHWMEAGASNRECSETYAGPVAFSEIESRNLRDYLLNVPNLQAYISLHSYGQYILYPWGWTSSLPSNWRDLEDLGQNVESAIRAVNGTRYSVGSSTNVLYSASGNSVDWAMATAGASYSYTIELPGGGRYGFDLPPERIVPVVIETFEGIRALGEYFSTL